jgi:DMSO/TMAO reductase YedYZ molybdopterin-dependent catalytic subunit
VLVLFHAFGPEYRMSFHQDQDTAKYQPGDPPRPEEFEAGAIISPDARRTHRLPPGQTRTRKWPVLDAFGVPQFDLRQWSLRIFGLVERELTFNLQGFQALPRVRVFADFHCVTRWSRLGNLWEGVSTRELLGRAGVKPEAHFVVCHAYDNDWTTNLPLEHFLAQDALLADLHDGKPITAEHGGPVRGMVPQLYAWKSAKWIKAIELVAVDQPGFWEERGYHLRGDPWREERYRDGW